MFQNYSSRMHRSSRSCSVKNEKAQNTVPPISWAASSRQTLCKAFYNIQWLQEQSDFVAPFVLLSCVAASGAHLSPCIPSTSYMDKQIEWLPAALTCYPASEWATGYDMARWSCRRPFPAQKLPPSLLTVVQAKNLLSFRQLKSENSSIFSRLFFLFVLVWLISVFT